MNKITFPVLLLIGFAAHAQVKLPLKPPIFWVNTINNGTFDSTVNEIIDSLEKKIDSLTKVIQSYHQLEGLYPPTFQILDSRDLPMDSVAYINCSVSTISLPTKQALKDRRYYKRHGYYPQHKKRRKNPYWRKNHPDTKE